MTSTRTTTSLQAFKDSLLSTKDLGLEDQVKAVQFLENRLSEARNLAGEKCEELKRALSVKSENDGEPGKKKQKSNHECFEENGNTLPISEGTRTSTTQSVKLFDSILPFRPIKLEGANVSGGTNSTQPIKLFSSAQSPISQGGNNNVGGITTAASEAFFNSFPSLRPITTHGKNIFGGTSTPQSRNYLSSTQPLPPGTFLGPNMFGGTSPTQSGGVFRFGSKQQEVEPFTFEWCKFKFRPTIGSEVIIKEGVQVQLGTMIQCITVMKEYENSSLEELRFQDYIAGRKGIFDVLKEEVSQLKRKLFNEQKLIQDLLGCTNVLQVFHKVSESEKEQKLLEILKKPNGDLNKEHTLIFVKDNATSELLSQLLMEENLSAFENPSGSAEMVLSFSTDIRPILVVTDEASRGNHIPDVAHVINYDLPDSFEVFLQRIRRIDQVSQLWGTATSLCDVTSDILIGPLVKMLTVTGCNVPLWLEGTAKETAESDPLS